MEKTRLKFDKNYKRIQALERRLPWMKKVTRHPTYGPWVPVLFAVVEVLFGIFVFGLIVTFLSKLIPHIPWPNINIPWPDINLPRIPLPDIPLPDFPELPEWLKEILYWVKRTWPIWVAAIFAIHEVRKRKKQ